MFLVLNLKATWSVDFLCGMQLNCSQVTSKQHFFQGNQGQDRNRICPVLYKNPTQRRKKYSVPHHMRVIQASEMSAWMQKPEGLHQPESLKRHKSTDAAKLWIRPPSCQAGRLSQGNRGLLVPAPLSWDPGEECCQTCSIRNFDLDNEKERKFLEKRNTLFEGQTENLFQKLPLGFVVNCSNCWRGLPLNALCRLVHIKSVHLPLFQLCPFKANISYSVVKKVHCSSLLSVVAWKNKTKQNFLFSPIAKVCFQKVWQCF